MNELSSIARTLNQKWATPTQAAEGLLRRRWSVAEVRAMVEAGIIDHDERFELIGGEAVPMNPKGIAHERIKAALLDLWFRARPSDVMLIPETSFYLADDTFCEPDITVYPTDPGLAGLDGKTVLLCVEISDTTLKYDLGTKADTYAAFGVREYWVIDTETLITRIHRDPSPTGYRRTTEAGPHDRLVPHLVPAFAVTLGDLELH
jgi:Uma2 family endonuclease